MGESGEIIICQGSARLEGPQQLRPEDPKWGEVLCSEPDHPTVVLLSAGAVDATLSNNLCNSAFHPQSGGLSPSFVPNSKLRAPFMAALCNRAGHYMFALWISSFFFFMVALCNRADAGTITFSSCFFLLLLLLSFFLA